MSQVLEKPILLDETGQDISSKINGVGGKIDSSGAAIVDVLKDAIGTSSEFIPVSIRVITPPTKTIYKVGERLDLTGMVVNLIGSNGVQIDVTSSCTFNPANGTSLTTSDTSVAISYLYQHDGTTFTTSQALVIRELSSIAVTTPPIKTAYQTGETLDLTGIVVTATYSDGFTANVTSDCTFNPANGTVLTTSDTSVTITYVEGSITTTTSVAIGVKELVSIAVTHLPTKTAYKAGETLDLTGLVVTATYDDSSTIDVTARCTFNPDDGDTLTTSDSSVAISYTEGTVTKTTSQAITVIELSSIAITTPPTETDYTVGDTLDLTGIVVTATYSDSSTADVTSSCTFSPADGATLAGTDTGVTASYTDMGVTKTATQAITVSYPMYGVEWDGTATTSWTRTDLAANFTDPVPYFRNMSGTPSSPFDNIMPWAGMERVEDSDAGNLVKIPKFWYKWTRDGAKMKLQISNGPASGFHVSPAHADRGDGQGERDYVYVGAHHCTGSYKSLTGGWPNTERTRATYRTNIHNLGSDIWQWDYAMYWTICMLYLVEYADWNSQDKLGYGCGDNSSSRAEDLTSMPYHSGSNMDYQMYGYSKYRHIEALWDNVYTFIDGIYLNSSTGKVYCINNPADFSDTTGGTYVGDVQQNAGYISSYTEPSATGFEYALCPNGISGGNSTYICDMKAYGWSPVLFSGGQYAQSKDSGLFYFRTTTADATMAQLGSRLMKLPSNS